MASSAQLKFTYADSLEKVYTENLGHVDRTKYAEQMYSSDTAVKRALLEGVDSGCRAIAALTTNTYKDAMFVSQVDVNEELAELDGE